jgi:hypothetical protein
MNTNRRHLHMAVLWASIVLALALPACGTLPEYASTPTPNGGPVYETPLGTNDQAALAAAPAQEIMSTNDQAVATAEIVRANAQATLNAASSTLNAARTQDQNDANVVAARIASTAELERAHAQATLVAAGSTQGAAWTQDAIRQTQSSDMATTGAEALVNQRNQDQLAASTQTAVANNIATQTQIAVATSQWYADQARQRDEERQVPIAFLWTWCLPVFLVLIAGLILWGLWRWLRIRQANQNIVDGLLRQLPASVTKVIDHQPDVSAPYPEGGDVDSRYQLTKPDDQVHRWLDEVKRKLRSSDQKDQDDDAGN